MVNIPFAGNGDVTPYANIDFRFQRTAFQAYRPLERDAGFNGFDRSFLEFNHPLPALSS